MLKRLCSLQPGELDVDKLRAELEQQLQMWSHPAATPDASWEEVKFFTNATNIFNDVFFVM